MQFLIALILFSSIAPQDQAIISKPRDPLGENISGDRQIGVVQQPLKRPIIVALTDRKGNPISGKLLSFRVVGEPQENRYTGVRASLRETEVYTDPHGYAKTYFTLGAAKGRYYVMATSPHAEGELYFTFLGLERSWLLSTAIGIGGGLALFLFGFGFGSRGLTRAAGDRLRKLLWNLTKNRLLGLIAGISITTILQSSTAATVMLVSFANADLISIGQTLGVILGADIGTTITVQVIAFKIMDYALIVIALGLVIMTFFRKSPHKYIGQSILGFGLLFYGMKVMADSVGTFSFSPAFQELIGILGDQPLLGLLIATLLTALLHSSAATIGIVLMLSFQGLIDLRAAMPIVLGANIGTCITALTASIRGSTEARRTAVAHTLFKILTVGLVFGFITQFADLVQKTSQDASRQIANAHTLFNLLAACVFLPLLEPYRRFLTKLIPVRAGVPKKFKPLYLDERVLNTPSLALGYASREIIRMAEITYWMVEKAMEVFKHNDGELRKRLIEEDDKVDCLEETITPYLTKLSQQELSLEQSKREVELLYIVDELEHIGDIVSKNLMSYSYKKMKRGLLFSEEGMREIGQYHGEVLKTFKMAILALTSSDRSIASEVAKRRQFLDELLREFHQKHIDRLHRGLKESLETSTVHLDFISDLERINFHTSNIGTELLGTL